MPAPDHLTLVLPPAPSVNSIYTPRRGGGIGYTAFARKWKKLTRQICIVQAYQQGWEPLDTWTRVVFRPFWPDRMVRDVTNLHKVVCDVLSTVAYSDDRWALSHDEIPQLDRAHPRLELQVYLEPGCERVVCAAKTTANTTANESVSHGRRRRQTKRRKAG